MEIYPYPVKES